MRIAVWISILLFAGCQENFDGLITYEKIAGEVIDEVTLEPIEGARITTNPITDLQFSDENGRFLLDSLSSRIYSVRVVADGYQAKLASFNIDDIENADLLILMTKDSTVSISPTAPFNPSPENNLSDQPLSVNLTWSSLDDQDSLRYNVYFFRPDMIASETILANSLDTTVLVSNLRFNTTYFWQVEAVDNEGNSILGPTWNFITKTFPNDDFRYSFIRKNGAFEQIYIGNENQEAVQLTSALKDHWRPTFSPLRNKLAFLSLENGAVHIFTMDRNGANVKQVSNSRAFRTKNVQDSPFSWAEEGERIIYMDFDKILSITKDGTGLQEIPFESNGEIVTSVDYSSLEGGRLVITTEAPSSRTTKLFLYEMEGDSTTQLLDSLEGQFSHVQFSPSGRQIIFSFNEEDQFSTGGVPLNKRMFHYDLVNMQLIDLSSEKEGGTADSNPRFAGNGDFVAFDNGNSDGVGGASVLISNLQDIGQNQEIQRDTLFRNASMIDWE